MLAREPLLPVATTRILTVALGLAAALVGGLVFCTPSAR